MAAAAVLCMASCSKQANATDAEEAQATTTEVATEEAAPATEAGKVVVFDNDTTLDFNAVWCGPCKQLHPVFEEAAKTFSDVRFISVDIDNLPLTAQAFGVEAVPTVVFLKPDGTTQTFVGTQDLLPAEKFDKLVRDNK